jgi:hypothetical protein
MAKWAIREINRYFRDYDLYTVLISKDGMRYLTKKEIKNNNWKFRKIRYRDCYHCYDKNLNLKEIL